MMKRKLILATLCSLLLVYAPVAGAGRPTALGKLDSKGPTEVNGAATSTETTVFPDDRITTQREASASLSLASGSQLTLAASSSLQMKDTGGQSAAKLERGGVAVLSRASAPVVVEAGGVRVHASNGGGVFAVILDGNNLKVLASKGAAKVEAANRTVEVGEGKMLEAAMAPQQPVGEGALSEMGTFELVLLSASAAAAFVALGIAVKKLSESCTGTPSPFSVTCD
jgi:hypothetical protein